VKTEQVLTLDDLKRMQAQSDAVYVDPGVISYAVSLVSATRNPQTVGQGHLARFITYGASPRASINLILAGRALAFLRGRDFVLPTDVAELSGDVLRHRMVLSYEALAEDLTADDILEPIVAAVPQPPIVMRDRAEEAQFDEVAYQRPATT